MPNETPDFPTNPARDETDRDSMHKTTKETIEDTLMTIEILAAYADAAAQPGGTRLSDWVRRYPQQEQELVELALYDCMLENARPLSTAEAAADEALFLSRAKAVRERMRRAETPRASFASLTDAAKAHGISLPVLAQTLSLGRAEMVKLDRRLFHPTSLPVTLVRRLAEAIQQPFAEVVAYLRQPPTLSLSASYKSQKAPRIESRADFADALTASREMTDDQKAAWRAELNDLLHEE